MQMVELLLAPLFEMQIVELLLAQKTVPQLIVLLIGLLFELLSGLIALIQKNFDCSLMFECMVGTEELQMEQLQKDSG